MIFIDVLYENKEKQLSETKLPIALYAFTFYDDYNAPPHWHSNVEILYFVSGKADVVIGGKHYFVDKNSLFLIRPFEVHSVHYVESAVKTRQFIISFNIELLSYYALSPIYTFYFNPIFINEAQKNRDWNEIYITNDDIPYLADLFENATNEYESRKHGYEFILLGEIYKIFAFIIRFLYKKYPDIINNLNEEKLLSAEHIEIIKFVNNHYCEDLKASEVAKRFSISYSYLSKIFRRMINMTFKEYITHLRINKAERLLHDHSMNITQIALEVGFANSSYFIEQFKKAKGISPHKYR